MNIDPQNAELLATICLALFGGFCCTVFLRSCLGIVLVAAVVVAVITALIAGHSSFLEALTLSLSSYIQSNPHGFVAFIVGMAVGVPFKGYKYLPWGGKS